MTLPNQTITKIPDTEPAATPGLWNSRYDEIDENFAHHEGIIAAGSNELAVARGGKQSLGARLDEIASHINVTSVDLQNNLIAAVKFAIDQAHIANRGVRALHQFSQQEGVLEIINRGVVGGCTVTKSTTAARNLHISAGICFAQGRRFPVAAGNNVASVPSNTGAGAVTAFAYLFMDASLWRLAVTPIGQDVPAGSIRLYNLTVPANSTDTTDPNLAAITLTDVRRVESGFPILLDSPASVSPQLAALPDSNYLVIFDVLSASGAPAKSESLMVTSRANNGFTVMLASAADNVVARWRVSRLNA